MFQQGRLVPAWVPESRTRQTSRNRPTYFGSMPRPNKNLRPKLELEAEALAALEQARTMPPGPERNEAMKHAGILRNAAELQGIFFAKRGRPAKSQAWSFIATRRFNGSGSCDSDRTHAWARRVTRLVAKKAASSSRRP